jgi:hypothetical protein
MKRGLITWDRAELPPSVFESRLAAVRKALAERDLPALVVHTDVLRSNQARFLTNYMPYWNRSLVVVPQDSAPVLLCGLSPRVYPWIRSVAVLEEIRPAGKLLQALSQLCTERQWKKVAVLDFARLPHEVHAPLLGAEFAVADLRFADIFASPTDSGETAMRKSAAGLARRILEQQLPQGAGNVDHQFVGRLELVYRRAGAEDLLVLLGQGDSAPRPPNGTVLGERYSVAVALEYRGHWVKVTRSHAAAEVQRALHDQFALALRDGRGHMENLSGPYPYESCEITEMNSGSIFALHVDSRSGGQRLFYGDTCRLDQSGAKLL